jgi:hypothetical protein
MPFRKDQILKPQIFPCERHVFVFKTDFFIQGNKFDQGSILLLNKHKVVQMFIDQMQSQVILMTLQQSTMVVVLHLHNLVFMMED